MSLKSEIAKSLSYLRSARRAILGRGGEISATAGLKDLPDAIYGIPADASLAYRSDDSVAYEKIVPSGAEEFAQVAKVGGMTYKTDEGLIDTKVTHLVSEGVDDAVIDTFPISAELRAFLEPYGYGMGVNGMPNEIDFIDKKFYSRVFRGTILSSSRWTLSNGFFQIPFSRFGFPSVNTTYWYKSLSDEYKCDNNHAEQDKVFWWNSTGTYFIIKDTRFSTIEEFNAHLEQNHISIIYALATPPEPIDISSYLTDDNFIKVEGGGVIKAVNEYEQDAPSTINYIEKVGI